MIIIILNSIEYISNLRYCYYILIFYTVADIGFSLYRGKYLRNEWRLPQKSAWMDCMGTFSQKCCQSWEYARLSRWEYFATFLQ